MRSLEEIKKEMRKYWVGGLPTELDQGLNDLNREFIETYKEKYPEALLVRISRGDIFTKASKVDKVYNFQFNFIIDCYNSELSHLIRKWRLGDKKDTLEYIYAWVYGSCNGYSFNWV